MECCQFQLKNAMKPNKEWSRRNFLKTTSAAGTFAVMNPFSAFAQKTYDIDPKVAAIVAQSFAIDTHNHMDVSFDGAELDAQAVPLSNELRRSGFKAMSMTFCVDRPKLNCEGEAFERFITSLDKHDQILRANGIKRVLNSRDLLQAKKARKSVVIQSVEGGHFLEGKLERLEVAYNRGLRHLGLLHDAQSAYPLGDIYTNPSQFGGLTPLGLEVVTASEKAGILVDLAHCSDEAINDALEKMSKPAIISHTGLNTQLGNDQRMAKMMMPRLISKQQAKIVAEAGGVIGVWTHLVETPTEMAQHIAALCDIVGTRHVSIGTDSRMAVQKGGNARGLTNQFWHTSAQGFFYALVDAMLKIGFTKEEILNIGGDNYGRIFEQAITV